MDAPLIATSARKHGIHDDDMLHAFNNPISVDDLDDGFVMFVGADIARQPPRDRRRRQR